MIEERMVLVELHLFLMFLLCVYSFSLMLCRLMLTAFLFLLSVLPFACWCLGILLPSSWSASDAWRLPEDILMPELKALGVEWKGESACENASGLDFWWLLQVVSILTCVFFVCCSTLPQALDFLCLFDFGWQGVHSGFAVHGCRTFAFANPLQELRWQASSWIWVLLSGGHPTLPVVMFSSLRM